MKSGGGGGGREEGSKEGGRASVGDRKTGKKHLFISVCSGGALLCPRPRDGKFAGEAENSKARKETRNLKASLTSNFPLSPS